MTDPLVEWLRAVLEEAERAALACSHRAWTRDGGSIYGDHETDPIVDWVYDDGAWEHIARHDPASVLADIAAKRAILEFADRVLAARDEHDATGALFSVPIARARIRDVLRLLASAYRDRPGFLPEWEPVRHD
jgi:hypothetical protein